MQIGTTDNVDFSRFEVYADGRLAGYSSYRIRNGRMSMLHTWTDPGFQRRALPRQSYAPRWNRRGYATSRCCHTAASWPGTSATATNISTLCRRTSGSGSTCSPSTAQALSAAATSSLEWSGRAELVILVMLAMTMKGRI
jgi:hypothetical protein